MRFLKVDRMVVKVLLENYFKYENLFHIDLNVFHLTLQNHNRFFAPNLQSSYQLKSQIFFQDSGLHNTTNQISN